MSEEKSWLKTAKETLAKRTIPAYIDFCKEVHEFRVHCDSSQGGSEFSRKGCEWLGCSSSTLHQWEAVGRRAEELSAIGGNLPISEKAISAVAALDDIAFPKAIEKLEPGMTQAQVEELIKDVNPPVKREPADPEDADRKKAGKLIAARALLRQKDRYR